MDEAGHAAEDGFAEGRPKRPPPSKIDDTDLPKSLRHRISFCMTDQSPFKLAVSQVLRNAAAEENQPPEDVIFLLDEDRQVGASPPEHAPSEKQSLFDRAEPDPSEGAPKQPPARKCMLSAMKHSISHDDKSRMKFLRSHDIDKYKENKINSGVIHESHKDYSVFSHSSEAITLSEFGVSPKRAFEYKASVDKRNLMLKAVPVYSPDEPARPLRVDSGNPVVDSKSKLSDHGETSNPHPESVHDKQSSDTPGPGWQGLRVSSRTVYILLLCFIALMLTLELWNTTPSR